MHDIDERQQNIEDISTDLLKILLSDKTTGQYIRWGSDNYIEYGPEYHADQEMKPELIIGNRTEILKPRVEKDDDWKVKRTRDSAEVFTPAWVCNEQNNLIDSAWFGRKNVFNIQKEKGWKTKKAKIVFPRDKIWKDYIYARRLEVCCGEAPYLVSRYDAVSGESLPIKERIGFLDRKLRVVTENAEDDKEWYEWAIKAFQNIYGYDFQGDNVLLARENLLYTFIDYWKSRTGKLPKLQQMKRIANIVSWNIFQMNGVTMTSPYSVSYQQMTLFDFVDVESIEEEPVNEMPCKIYDWRSKVSIEFRSMMGE